MHLVRGVVQVAPVAVKTARGRVMVSPGDQRQRAAEVVMHAEPDLHRLVAQAAAPVPGWRSTCIHQFPDHASSAMYSIPSVRLPSESQGT